MPMKPFARQFTPASLATDDPIIKHLFSRWALPGEVSSDERSLRIGIRDGYLNFYRLGQSVAKLSTANDRWLIAVHPAYFEQRVKAERGANSDLGSTYKRIRKGQVTPDDIDAWIATAATYASAEKAFVDDLIGATHGVIDLEMALPRFEGWKDNSPRMDLVVAEGAKIVFWEAKCSDNKELRAGDMSRIRIIEQADKYLRWMNESGQHAVVATAYAETARVLGELADRFACPGSAARAAWKALADAPSPKVIAQPRIVIGKYCARTRTGFTERDKLYSKRAAGNEPYVAYLETAGLRVHQVGRNDGRRLPDTDHVGVAPTA